MHFSVTIPADGMVCIRLQCNLLSVIFYFFATLDITLVCIITCAGGLLHSVPQFEDAGDVNMSEKVANTLRECVRESSPGRRVQAVNDLSDTLALYLKLA